MAQTPVTGWTLNEGARALFLQRQAAAQYARCRFWADDPAAHRLPSQYLHNMQRHAAMLSHQARAAAGVE